MYDPGQAFVDRSRRLLTHDYLPRIRGALAHLTEEDLWWRPNDVSNSTGNLLLHLAGNARQWIVCGVGGAPDERERAQEFARRGGMATTEALSVLEGTVDEVDRVLGRLDRGRLGQRLTVQGNDVTVLEAIYHVVEHFSMHTGQILYIAKLRSGRDLGFWRVHPDGTAVPRW